MTTTLSFCLRTCVTFHFSNPLAQQQLQIMSVQQSCFMAFTFFFTKYFSPEHICLHSQHFKHQNCHSRKVLSLFPACLGLVVPLILRKEKGKRTLHSMSEMVFYKKQTTAHFSVH